MNQKSDPTVQDLVDCYLIEVLRSRSDRSLSATQGNAFTMRLATARVYQSYLRKYIAPKWGTYAVSDFEKPEIWASVREWLDSLKRSETDHVALAPLSVRRVYDAMRRVFQFAVQTGYLAFDPFTKRRGGSTM